MTTVQFPGKWTMAKIEALEPSERHQLWINCRASESEEGQAFADALAESGLPFSEDGALCLDDPIALKMDEIITSSEGRAACIKATRDGLPALAGVDGMINQALGVDYGSKNMGTHTAGWFVGELMRSLGYVLTERRKMPVGSVAKTAAFWTKRT
jgi:hypothetical protein